jgi:protein-L-isoaspartate O-methyltransferase
MPVFDHMKNSVSEAAFEAKYRESTDPWQFAVSPYEQQRYAATLRSLTQAHYARAFEPGCSVGVLTAALAERCDNLLACDIAPTAVCLARERCAGLPNVRIEQADLAESIPPGPFDLIVFSEIGYYFEPAALIKIVCALATRMARGGEFVAVHWRGESQDHVLHGDEVHALLKQTLEESGTWRNGQRRREFRLDLWQHA